MWLNGADVNGRDLNLSSTPIHLAVQEGHFAMVKLLIENGADINAQDAYGRTALDFAKWRGHLDIIDYLELLKGGD